MAFHSVFLLIGLFQLSNGFLTSPFHHSFGPSPNVLCIMEHCASESAACAVDVPCRSNMECMTSCGLTNHTCMYRCMNTYEDGVFDSMMNCLVDQYHCMDLEPPNPDFRCKPPSYFVKNFTLSQLTGSWYIVRGLNRDYDCFDCQISTYSPIPNSRNYSLVEKYDAQMLNGSIRHRQAIQQVEQKDIFNGGMLDYTDTLMGLDMYEKWQVLDYGANGSYMVVYYCGRMSSNWWYEGNLVYSRSPTLNPSDVPTIAAVLKKYVGHDMSDYCVPNTQNCKTGDDNSSQ